jgi:hypothetical protein
VRAVLRKAHGPDQEDAGSTTCLLRISGKTIGVRQFSTNPATTVRLIVFTSKIAETNNIFHLVV